MVNQAVKTMFIEKFDKSKWVEICKTLSIPHNDFSSFEQYDDEITLKLVTQISEFAEIEPTDLLESFGIYWIKYARESEYQSIIENFANSPVELIESLDHLHTRLELFFENLSAPSFWTTRVNDNEVLVHYASKRDLPLEYFVLGLLKGIFNMFDKECNIELLETKSHKEKALFRICY